MEDNDELRCGMYNKDMKEMFKKIPTTMYKTLSPKQKVQKLMTEIGGGWYMGENAKGIPALMRSKLSKKYNIRSMKLNKNYTKLISGGIIENSNYIGTSLNGLIQEVKPKGINTFQFLQESFT